MSWSFTTLKEICSPKQHKTISTSELLDSGYPIFGANGQIGYYSQYTHERETIAITCRGATCGTINIAPEKCYINGNAMALDDLREDKVNLRFLAYFFSYRGLNDVISGSAQPQITRAPLLDLQIPLPPLEEQKRIAAILDQADALRRLRQRSIDRLNSLGQAIFYEMFGEWDKFGNDIPTVILGEHLDFLTSGSRGWAEFYRDQGSLFLRIQNIHKDELDLSDVAYVDAPDTTEAKRTRVNAGDVLLSITADLGRTAVIPDNIGEAFINQHLAILRTGYFNPRFLSAALTSPAGQRSILKRNREGVKAGLNFDDIRSVTLPKVSFEQQVAFEKRVKAVDILKANALHSMTNLNDLFASIQNKAFNGELSGNIEAELHALREGVSA
jgi:type I restriction enzyme S subunit